MKRKYNALMLLFVPVKEINELPNFKSNKFEEELNKRVLVGEQASSIETNIIDINLNDFTVINLTTINV